MKDPAMVMSEAFCTLA